MKAKLGVASIILATTFHSGEAAAEKLHTIDVNGDGRQIAYTYCVEPDPWVECVSHELKCSPEGLFVTLGGFSPADAVKVTKALLDMGPMKASVRFLLADGKISIDLWAPVFEVHSNDMDGVWNLEINLHDEALLWSAMSEPAVRGAKVVVGDQTIDISPDHGAEALLMKMKKACEKPAQ